jgi:hypothetical protein
MTPEAFIRFRETQERRMRVAQEAIDRALRKAKKSKPPKTNLRRATPDDIQPGQIIWHGTDDRDLDWHIVEEVLQPDDKFKAYVAEDGCRYGLDQAWVRRS